MYLNRGKQCTLSAANRLHEMTSRKGLVQVWFSLQLKFNSSELDSEVGRLVIKEKDRISVKRTGQKY